jgi:hypothetical protein
MGLYQIKKCLHGQGNNFQNQEGKFKYDIFDTL